TGDDLMTGGTGLDTANYSNRPTAVRADSDGVADDGEIGIPEHDNVNCEEIVGGAGNDTLTGLAGQDFLDGGGGNDSLVGNDGNDQLTGSAGADNMQGGQGDDFLQAQDGQRDTVNGGTGPGATDLDLASIDSALAVA